jgi:hypothetical protein
MRPIVVRHAVLASLPLLLGLALGWGFAWQQESCGRLVGLLFAAKCGRIQVEYQLWFQTAGTVLGTLLAVTIGIWLERRRTRRASSPPPAP